MTENVNSHQFLIREVRFLGIIAPALKLSLEMGVVHRADPRKELNELGLNVHSPHSTILRGFALLPLIRIR